MSDEPAVLRSINNRHRAIIRFCNTTPYDVEVLWINYEGQAVRYGILNPGGYLDINTFATHPWIFVETETRDRFLVDGKDVFLPKPWFVHYRDMPRSEWPKTLERVRVNITLPIYTLRDLTLRFIKRHLRQDHHAFLLEIPKSLQYELASMLPRKADPAEP